MILREVTQKLKGAAATPALSWIWRCVAICGALPSGALASAAQGVLLKPDHGIDPEAAVSVA